MTFRGMVFLVLAPFALAACGGGGESAPPPVVTPPPTGGSPPTPAPPPPASTPAFRWGANGHPVTAYPGLSLEQQFQHLIDLGAPHYRVNLRGDGSADRLEQIANAAAGWRIEILPILQPDMDLAGDSAAALYRKGYDLAFVMGSRFKGRFPVWELGNELEIFALLRPCDIRDDGTQYPCEWGIAGGVEPTEYHGGRWSKVAAVLDGLSDGLHAADPAAKRALGSAGWGHTGMFDRMAQSGIAWEISVWHDYAADSEWAFQRLARFGKPIWITEFNDGGGGTDPVAQAAGAKNKVEQYRRLSATYRIEAAYVYELFDEPYWGDTFEARMGLVRLDPNGASWKPGAKKPAFDAVRSAIAGP